MQKAIVKTVKPSLVSFLVEGKVFLLTGKKLALTEGQEVILNIRDNKIVGVAVFSGEPISKIEYRKLGKITPKAGRPCEIKTRVEHPLNVLFGSFIHREWVDETYSEDFWVECQELDSFRSEIARRAEFRSKASFEIIKKESTVNFYRGGLFSHKAGEVQYKLNNYAKNYGVVINGKRVKEDFIIATISQLGDDFLKVDDYFLFHDGEETSVENCREKVEVPSEEGDEVGIMTGWRTLGSSKPRYKFVDGKKIKFVRTFTPKEGFEFLGTHRVDFSRFEPN